MRFYQILFFQLIFLFSLGSLHAQKSHYDKSEEKLYQEGVEYLIKSNYSAARRLFEDYLTVGSTNISANKINAQYYVAFAALHLYNNDGEHLIKKFIDQYPNHPKSLDANYELGKFYYAENNAVKAIKYLTQAEKGGQGTQEQIVEIKYKLGYSLFSKKKFEDAVLRFNDIKNQTGEYFAASNYYAGYIEYENEDYDDALKDLKKAEKSENYRRNVPYMVCAIYYNIKDFTALINYAEPMLGSSSKITNRNDVVLLIADANYNLGNFDKANQYYTDYLDKVKNSKLGVPLQYRIGYVAYLNKNMELAINSFKKVASVSDDNLGYYASYYLGILYTDLNKKMYAITAFDKARKLLSDKKIQEESLFLFAKLNYDLGRTSEAIKGFQLYNDQFKSGKHIDEVDDLIAEVYFNTNNYDKALSYIEKINNRSVRVKEMYQKASYHKGVIEFNKSKYSSAIDYFNQATKEAINKEIEIKTHFWLAETYTIIHKYDRALTHYQKVIWNADNRTVEKSKSLYGLGYLYYNSKDYQNAANNFKTYIKSINPQRNKRMYNDALIRLADCYYVNKKYVMAIDTYKKSIQFSKIDNDYAEFQLGVIYGIEGQINKAITSYNIVINNYAHSKYNDDALFYKAQLQFENGDFSSAVRGFTLLIAQKRTGRFTPYAYLKRAVSYFNLQKYANCIEDYEKLISEFSTHKVAQQSLLSLQEVLALENRSTEFDQYLSIYKQANPDDKSTESIEFQAAKTLYYNQQLELSKNKLLSFIDSYPQSSMLSEAYFYLGEIDNYLGNVEEALTHYSIILEDINYSQYNRVVGRMAKIEQQQQRYDNAIYYFKTLSNSANNTKEQNASLIGLMECSYFLTMFDSCRLYADQLLALGTANAHDQNKASLFLGKSAMAKGDFQLAKDAFLQTLNTAKDVNGAEAQYLIGEILFLENEYEKSIETLVELNNSFYSYEYWLGKAFLLIVDNYIATNEFFQAKGTLSSIIESFPLVEIVDIAKIKLEEIIALELNELTNVKDSITQENDTTYVEN